MNFREIDIGDKAAWRQAIARAPYQFFHLPEAVEAFHGRRCDEIQLLHGAEGEAVCNLPLTVRSSGGKSDVATVYGYGGLTGAGLTAVSLRSLKTHLAAKGYVCAYVSLCPYADLAEAVRNEAVFSNAPTICLDLSQGLAPIERAMSSMRRRHVRIRRGVTIDREKTRQNSECFVRQYGTTMTLKGAPASREYPPDRIQHLIEMPEADLFVLKENGEPRSSVLFARTPFAADYILGGSDEGYRSFSSAALWAAVRHYAEAGVKLVNLGGGVTAGDSLQSFKGSFGGELRPFQCLKWILDPDAYRELCEAAGVSDDPATGFFPAYHGASETPRAE